MDEKVRKMMEKTVLEPDQLEALDMAWEQAVRKTVDPRLREKLAKLFKTMEESQKGNEVEEFKKEISQKPILPEQQIFAFLPHQMAKTSIFFPMSDRELKEENRKISKLEHETGWGKVVIEGVKLAIFEEDILLALLHLAKNGYKKFEKAFVLETNLNKIINILYGRKGYSKRNEEVILRCLKHFQLVAFDLIVGEWKKRGKEKLNVEKIRSIGNIVHSYKYDTKTKDIKISFNPEFFDYFLESMLTNINLTLRRKLKKDGSKALLRFLSTHSKPSRMHILTLLNAINFNVDQPLFRLRERIKGFIKELKTNGVLGARTKVFADDTVFFDILTDQKKLPPERPSV